MKFVKSFVIALLFFAAFACSDDDPLGPNEIGGDTNIDLTQVGEESTVYISIDDGQDVSATMTVLSRENGIVRYKLEADIDELEDYEIFKDMLPEGFVSEDGKVTTEMKFKITSEGIQDYFQGDKPWTIVKYNAKVGDEYTITTPEGNTLSRRVTEKTGVDDWPIGFMNIKTIKIEQDMPAGDDYPQKVIYRANHKFGIVYMETILKDGTSIKVDILPFFLLI
ncbi:MAG: hypothetical protein ACLFQU_11660 [Candidatus Kapaibacterium sp.]